MQTYYCENCVSKSNSVVSLIEKSCDRHPLGIRRGRHVLYDGLEKAQ